MMAAVKCSEYHTCKNNTMQVAVEITMWACYWEVLCSNQNHFIGYFG